MSLKGQKAGRKQSFSKQQISFPECQAGEIRSTRNFSGGESFITSLTLALGLSKMESQKVRVDSLFWMKVLDEDVLEIVLETFSGFQQDNKIIGVISHVPALKERISTQITIVQI